MSTRNHCEQATENNLVANRELRAFCHWVFLSHFPFQGLQFLVFLLHVKFLSHPLFYRGPVIKDNAPKSGAQPRKPVDGFHCSSSFFYVPFVVPCSKQYSLVMRGKKLGVLTITTTTKKSQVKKKKHIGLVVKQKAYGPLKLLHKRQGSWLASSELALWNSHPGLWLICWCLSKSARNTGVSHQCLCVIVMQKYIDLVRL